MTNLVKSSFIPDERCRRFLTIGELLNEADKTETLQLLSIQKRLQASKVDLVGFCFDPIAARYVNTYGKVGELVYLISPALDVSECDIITPYAKILDNRAFLTLQVASMADIGKVLSKNGPVPKNLLTLDVPWHNCKTSHIAKSIGWISIEEGFEVAYHDYVRVIFNDLVNYEMLLKLSDYLYQKNYYERSFE